MFLYFTEKSGCDEHKFVISFNLVLVVVALIVSVLPKVSVMILHESNLKFTNNLSCIDLMCTLHNLWFAKLPVFSCIFVFPHVPA